MGYELKGRLSESIYHLRHFFSCLKNIFVGKKNVSHFKFIHSPYIYAKICGLVMMNEINEWIKSCVKFHVQIYNTYYTLRMLHARRKKKVKYF